jgi:3-deoxy-D-manno-octulosonate 8-phosphate phosphatase (KDO 8-P phosphatase)
MPSIRISEELRMKASRIRLLLMDCDGVLTDGRLYFGPAGEVMKAFDVRDGQGIATWHRAGHLCGIITGRPGDIVKARADELGIKYFKHSSPDKAADVREILADSGISSQETAFVGDDIGDLPAMALVGLPIAVADAVDEVCEAALFITTKTGGRGAVREVIDLLLTARL